MTDPGDEQRALRSVITDLLRDHIGSARTQARGGAVSGFSPTLWDVVGEAGFDAVAVPASDGGSDGTWTDLATVVRAAGHAAAPVPMAEHNIARAVLSEHGRQPPAGPLAVVCDLADQPTTVQAAGQSWRLTGTLRDVAWAGVATGVVVVADMDGQGAVGVASPREFDVEARPNLAGEPAADIVLGRDGLALTPSGIDAARVQARHALAVALLISGSLRRVLALSIEYSQQREQFGRPIGRFQAVSHQLAELAGAVEQADALIDAAVATTQVGGPGPELMLAVKVVTDTAATAAVRIAHQVHGAMGVTEEYELHHHTMRLLAWRARGGATARAAAALGGLVGDGGPDALWMMLTAHPAVGQ